jgi:hypothetical protein
VRGDLVEEEGGWALVPHRMIGGLELPPVSRLRLFAQTVGDVPRLWRKAKKTRRELGA